MSDLPPPPDSTATSLIRRVQHGEPAAWERLTHLYGPVVYGWARRAGLQPQDASDVMQEVFHKLLPDLAVFRRRRPEDSFRGWLWTVCRNQIRDQLRQQRESAQPRGGTDARQLLENLPQTPLATEEPSSGNELTGLRRRALELISSDFESRTWQAFWRSTVEGDAPADVAADLGVSVWAVYKARARVLRKLRDEFSELLD